MHYTKEMQIKYDHAIGRMIDLFRSCMETEAALKKKLELARDELQRIAACPGANDEIKQLCDRGLNDTRI